MNILVNGVTRQLPEGSSIAQLLAELELTAQAVAVEVNLQLVPRERHAEHHLCEGDRLEIVTLVGGG